MPLPPPVGKRGHITLENTHTHLDLKNFNCEIEKQGKTPNPSRRTVMDIRLMNNVFFFCLFVGVFFVVLVLFGLLWFFVLVFVCFFKICYIVADVDRDEQGFLWFRASKPGCSPGSRNFCQSFH